MEPQSHQNKRKWLRSDDNFADKIKSTCFQITIRGQKMTIRDETKLDEGINYVWKRFLKQVARKFTVATIAASVHHFVSTNSFKLKCIFFAWKIAVKDLKVDTTFRKEGSFVFIFDTMRLIQILNQRVLTVIIMRRHGNWWWLSVNSQSQKDSRKISPVFLNNEKSIKN